MEIKKQKSGPKSPYSDSFRRMVVEEVLSGSYVAEVARKYGIPHRATIAYWIQWYQKNHDIVVKPLPMTDKEAQELVATKKRTKELEEALALAELKIAGLETMIDVAEKHLKIDIRKKSGAKQSK
jgi:transposase